MLLAEPLPVKAGWRTASGSERCGGMDDESRHAKESKAIRLRMCRKCWCGISMRSQVRALSQVS